MNFEYYPAKSASNEEKHGINFEEAQRLWEDPEMITMRVDRKGEFRKMLIARHAGCCWSAIYTIRPDNIRIISVRRSTGKEVSFYDRKRNE